MMYNGKRNEHTVSISMTAREKPAVILQRSNSRSNIVMCTLASNPRQYLTMLGNIAMFL